MTKPDPYLLFEQAEQLKEQGELEKAVEKLQEILAIEPAHVLSHLAMAVWCGRLERYEEAVHHAEQACHLEPNDPFNYTAMSITCQKAWAGTRNPDFIAKAEQALMAVRQMGG